MSNALKLSVAQIQGDFLATEASETVDETPVTITLILTDETNGTEWTFSEAAEDNGTAGDLDGQDGIIYNGPSGNYARLHVTDLDIDEGTISPEAADSVVAAVYINSLLHDVMETEDSRVLTGTGFVAEFDVTGPVEFNYDGMVGPLNEGDVVRFALLSGTEETTDWEVVAGGNFTLT